MEPHCDNVLEADDEDSAIKAISTDTGKDIQLVILDEFLIFLADSRTTMVNSLREAGYTGEIWVSSSMTYKGFVADYLLMGVDGLISKSCASLGLQDVYQVAVQA
jgi:DNA-binding NarL/FixJ family response regulator